MRQDASAAAADHAAPVSCLVLPPTRRRYRRCRDAPARGRSLAAGAPRVDHLESNYLAPAAAGSRADAQQESVQVIRSFRREMQITPHAYLIRLRIIHAIRLLQRGEAIAQVAAATGFRDQSHLTRHFKRWTGTTPASRRGPGRGAGVLSAGPVLPAAAAAC